MIAHDLDFNSQAALYSLDDTTLKSRLEVGQKSIGVANAELQVATQKSFDTPQSKGKLAFLSGRVQEKLAELVAVKTQLARINVPADHDGIAVFGDPDDWLARPIKLFLTVMPLSPLDAKITETSHQAVISPDGVASYRLRAAFDNREHRVRIGLRGTAKVYGDWVFLGYYILRRPLGTLRGWIGW